MDEKQFKIICEKLDRLAALISIQNMGDQDKKINILKRSNLTSKEIGDMLGLEESGIRHSKGWKK